MKTIIFSFFTLGIVTASLSSLSAETTSAKSFGITSSNISGALHSDLIRVEGASEKSMARVQKAIETAAYGADGLKAERPTISRGTAATRETESDSCDSFYMPRPKLRLTKKLPEIDPCATVARGEKAALIADTDVQILFLCKDGVSVADYDFSMGRNGVEKRVLGDMKTPLGTYPLGAPRGSDLFKVFIPVGYPTKLQKQQGLTGSDIGIHGPSRPFRCAGFLNASVNWTQGCIAVASDIFIKEIGRFVQDNQVKEMTILPLESSR